jgi:hypothetical protein
MQPQGAPMLGYCCVLCHRFMQTFANSTVAGIPQWPVLPRSLLHVLMVVEVAYNSRSFTLTDEWDSGLQSLLTVYILIIH